MKNCNEVREMLSFYLDNELHENERKLVVKHLENCIDCKAELESLKNIVEQINEIEEVELPLDFNEKLHEKLVEVSKKSQVISYREKNVVKVYYIKLVEYISSKKNTAVFKYASLATACFIFLFAVGYSGMFERLFDDSELAYINDAEISQVDKNAFDQNRLDDIMDQRANKQKSVDSDNAGVRVFSDMGEREAFKNATLRAYPSNKIAANTAEPNSIAPAKPNAKTATTQTPTQIASNKKENLTLVVNNSSEVISEIFNSVKNSGGQISEKAMITAYNTKNTGSERNFTVTVPAKSYESVVNSLNKIGNTQNPNEVMHSMMSVADEVPQEASTKSVESNRSVTTNDNVKINIIIEASN